MQQLLDRIELILLNFISIFIIKTLHIDEFSCSTKATLLKFAVTDFWASEPTQSYKGRFWGCAEIWFRQQLLPGSYSSWYVGEKGGEEKGLTKEQKSGHGCEANFMPAAETEAENIECQMEVYPPKLSSPILHNKEIWLVQIRGGWTSQASVAYLSEALHPSLNISIPRMMQVPWLKQCGTLPEYLSTTVLYPSHSQRAITKPDSVLPSSQNSHQPQWHQY